MKSLLVGGVAVALLVAGCGGESAEKIVGRTADNLGKIRSGTLSARLVVSPRVQSGGAPFGFELRGPFALGKAGSLPVLDVAYTQIAGGKRATVTVLSTGSKAYVKVGDKAYVLPDALAAELRNAAQSVRVGGGYAKVAVGDWIEDPKRADCGQPDDADCVRAKLNVLAATNGLLGLARALGRHVPSIEGADAKQLQDATRDSGFELVTGKHDRLLRRLSLFADFALQVPPGLRAALGTLVGARIDFELAVANANRPVSVAAPSSALPYSALSRQ
jgi:hypothetical protein